MSKISKKILSELKSYKPLINKKYASEVDDAIDLYVKKQIPNIKTVEGILNGLMSRGNGPSKALAKIDKYRTTESITGRLSRPSNFDVVRDYLINYTIKFKLDGKTRERTRTINQKTSVREIRDRLQIYAESEVINNNNYSSEIEFEDVNTNSVKYYDAKPLSGIKLGHQKYSYKCLDNADKVNVNNGACVIDYIMFELCGKHGFKNLTRDSLIKFFGGQLASTDDIIEWCKKSTKVSVYAIDPLMQVFKYHKADNTRYTLVFVVNNDHLYPVLNADTKKSVVQSGKLSLNEYKFTINYDDIQYINNNQQTESTTSKVILFEDIDDVNENLIMQKMKKVMDTTGTMVEYIKFYNGRPVSFKHPITNQIYEITTNFLQRKSIIEKLALKYGQSVVHFQNQSYTQISQIIFNNEHGNTEQLKSNLSDNVWDVLNKYKIGPYCAVSTHDKVMTDPVCNFDKYNGFDICKSYASVLLNNDTPYPVFQQFDEIKEFKQNMPLLAGEYYISRDIELCDGLMRYSKGFYPLNFIFYLLNEEIITRSDITYCIQSKQYINAKIFSDFVKNIYNNYDEGESKQMINNFIGEMGTKYIKSDTGCITSSFDIATSILLSEQDKSKITLDTLNGLHFIRIKNKTKKFNTALPIQRHIICGGIINLANLYKKVSRHDNQIVALNTDSIMVYGDMDDKLYESINFNPSTSTLENIGKIRPEQWKIKGKLYTDLEMNEEFQYHPVVWNTQQENEDFTEFCQIIDAQPSALISGSAGCGKTEVIKNIRTENDLILCFTNKATENIISRCGDDTNIMTLDSFFHEHLTYQQKLDKASHYDRIIVDEYSMVPVKMMNLLNQIKQQQGKKLLFFGDANQCLAIDTNNIVYDYITTQTFSKMCNNNLFICSYKEQYSRYDIELKKELDYLLGKNKLSSILSSKTETFSYINICKSLKKKWEINQLCNEQFMIDNPTNKYVELESKQSINGKNVMIKFKYVVDMGLMCITNMKDIKLYNGSICKIDDITDDTIVVNGHIFNHQKFLSDFEPLYCQTVYKYQGSTIKDKFTIHEVSAMTKRELYTSLSRGKSLTDVSFKYDAKTFINRDTTTSTEQKVIVSNDIDEKYQDGKIYKITFMNHIYIGSTYRSLEERFEEHLKATSSRAGSLFIETLKQNKAIAKIELIKLYPCASQKQLVAEEEIYINDALGMSKYVCLNTMMTKKKNKVKNTEINMDRIELINLGEKEIQIVENTKNSLFRMRYTDEDGNKKDIKMKWNSTRTKEETLKAIQLKRLKIKII